MNYRIDECIFDDMISTNTIIKNINYGIWGWLKYIETPGKLFNSTVGEALFSW